MSNRKLGAVSNVERLAMMNDWLLAHDPPPCLVMWQEFSEEGEKL